MAEVYVQLSDDAVDSTRCIDGCVDINLDLNGAGEVVGVEVLGATAVEIDGKRVQDADEGGPERSNPKVIERVAHAISTAKYGRYVWDGLASCQQDAYREMASAAVQALLEER